MNKTRVMTIDRIDNLVEDTDADRSVAERLPSQVRQNFSPQNTKILIVDQESINIELATFYLIEEGYKQIYSTEAPQRALTLIRMHRPDCVLLALTTPNASSMKVLEEVRRDPELRNTPVILFTDPDHPDARLAALELGVNDFVSLPVDASELLFRLRNTLTSKALRDQLANYSAQLEREVQQRTVELEVARLEALNCLARAGEYRDDDTGEHVLRVGRYVGIIAAGLGFDPQRVELLEQSAQLHDVGKIGIPDAVLLKPGKLDTDQRDLMRKHCKIGKSILRPMTDEEWQHVRQRLRWGPLVERVPESPIMSLASLIAESHHERWDGKGYPLGLAGGEIPIEGRIAAVADVFDAVSSKRPYKDSMPWDKSLELIQNGSGSHFDPHVVEVFFDHLEEVRRVYLEHSDDIVRGVRTEKNHGYVRRSPTPLMSRRPAHR